MYNDNMASNEIGYRDMLYCWKLCFSHIKREIITLEKFNCFMPDLGQVSRGPFYVVALRKTAALFSSCKKKLHFEVTLKLEQTLTQKVRLNLLECCTEIISLK